MLFNQILQKGALVKVHNICDVTLARLVHFFKRL